MPVAHPARPPAATAPGQDGPGGAPAPGHTRPGRALPPGVPAAPRLRAGTDRRRPQHTCAGPQTPTLPGAFWHLPRSPGRCRRAASPPTEAAAPVRAPRGAAAAGTERFERKGFREDPRPAGTEVAGSSSLSFFFSFLSPVPVRGGWPLSPELAPSRPRRPPGERAGSSRRRSRRQHRGKEETRERKKRRKRPPLSFPARVPCRSAARPRSYLCHSPPAAPCRLLFRSAPSVPFLI